MKQITATLLLLAAIPACWADVRVKVQLGPGHPIHRNRRVIVRPSRPVIIRPNMVFAPPVAWAPRAVAAPPRGRMEWEDSETFQRREDWVDTTLSVNKRGNSVFLRIDGRAQIDFAEVHFANGQVQVVDFNDRAVQSGTYPLLDFQDGRQVEHVRLVARARSQEARITAFLSR